MHITSVREYSLQLSKQEMEALWAAMVFFTEVDESKWTDRHRTIKRMESGVFHAFKTGEEVKSS